MGRQVIGEAPRQTAIAPAMTSAAENFNFFDCTNGAEQDAWMVAAALVIRGPTARPAK